MRARIVCLPGDHAGPEVMQEAVRVLTSVACAFGHSFTFVEEKIGLASMQAHGTAFGEKAQDACLAADAILLGSADNAGWEGSSLAEEKQGFRLLAQGLSLYAGIQRAKMSPALLSVSALQESVAAGTDIALVRPLPQLPVVLPLGEGAGEDARDTVACTPWQAEQAARAAFSLAAKRRRSVVLAVSQGLEHLSALWRSTAQRLALEYPEISLQILEAEACAWTIVKKPARFDVILAGPPFSGFLSGLVSGLIGGPGLSPCLLQGIGGKTVYLPAPGDGASYGGQDTANPIAMILCAAMLLRHSLSLANEADCVEMAVENVLQSGWRTADLASGGAPRVGTEAIGKLIAEQVDTAGAVISAFRR